MKSKKYSQVILSTLVCLVPIILALVLYDKLPARLPTHFDINGEPNGYASRAVACFVLPCGLALVNLFIHFRLNTDPKRKNASSGVRAVGFWAVPVVSLIFIPITLYKAIGYNVPVIMISSALIGLICVIIGNYLPKCRQNYTVGIRLPWTLDNEENWNKTHRLSGFVWVLGGLAVIINTFIGSFFVTLSILVLLTIVPVFYSYLLFRKMKKE